MTAERRRSVRTSIIVAIAFLLIVGAELVRADAPPYVGCRPEPVTEHTPSGLAGCIVYGEGIASMWGGPGVARNDCIWPWTDCTPIRITSLDTGLFVDVTPTLFGDLYIGAPGPNGEQARIVDLDPATVAALGLDPSRGLWPVRVEPLLENLSSTRIAPLPDTAVRP